MSVSIYYTAKRDRPLKEEENSAVHAIADRYCKGYPFADKYEDFCLYEAPFDEADTVLQGATAIPADSEDVYDIILYWLDCLTDITRELGGCIWQANLDDVGLLWEDSWRLPDEI